jgi:hypothetical protein
MKATVTLLNDAFEVLVSKAPLANAKVLNPRRPNNPEEVTFEIECEDASKLFYIGYWLGAKTHENLLDKPCQ